MNSEESTSPQPVPEAAAALIVKTLTLCEKIRQAASSGDTLDPNLSSVLLSEGLDQLLMPRRESTSSEKTLEKSTWYSEGDAATNSSQNTVKKIRLEEARSSIVQSSSEPGFYRSSQRDKRHQRGLRRRLKNTEFSTNLIGEEVFSSCDSFAETKPFKENTSFKCDTVDGVNSADNEQLQESKLLRKNLGKALEKMRRILNTTEEQMYPQQFENNHKTSTREESNLSKKVDRRKPGERLSKAVQQSASTSTTSKIGDTDSTIPISFATVENRSLEMSAEWPSRDNYDCSLHDLQSVTEFFLKTIQSDWKESLPNFLKILSVYDLKQSDMKKTIEVLTSCIQFLCGRSAAMSERENCLIAEMNRLEEVERQLELREKNILSKERSLAESNKCEKCACSMDKASGRDLTRNFGQHQCAALQESKEKYNESRSWSSGKNQRGEFPKLKKTTVLYLSVPATVSSTSSYPGSNSKRQFDCPQIGSFGGSLEIRDHEMLISELQQRIHSAENKLGRVSKLLRNANNNQFSMQSFHTTFSGHTEQTTNFEMHSPSKASDTQQHTRSLKTEMEELREELTHHYKELQSSLTEALRSIVYRLDSQQIKSSHGVEMLGNDFLTKQEENRTQRQGQNNMVTSENSGFSLNLQSQSLLEALTGAETEWMRRLQVLRSLLEQYGNTDQQNIHSNIHHSKDSLSQDKVPNDDKLGEFILRFVRENEALETYWRRALESIPNQLESTMRSQTAVSIQKLL
eukprot:jgi/Galph1/4959/GphlegSOOS_G3676.1